MSTDAGHPNSAPLPHRLLLDPRAADVAATRSLARAVNIPAGELAARAHELPPRDQVVRVAAVDVRAAQCAADWLRGSGREALLVHEVSFAERDDRASGRLWEPTAFLAEVAAVLPAGAALDLACGTGRDPVYLSSAGWHVTAVDVLPDALERARSLEQRYARGARVRWLCADLERGAPPFAGQAFDLITAFRYLNRPLFARLREFLRPGGSVVLETFTTLHRARHGKPARDEFVLLPGELATLVPGLQIAHFSEAWRGTNHTARLWARR